MDAKQKTITIIGEVNYPGLFPLDSENDNIKTLISRAGGLTENAYLLLQN